MQAKIQFNCVISPYPAQKIVNLPLFKMNMELKEHFNNKIFKLISETADELGLECYVVGGYVRDIFLKRPSKDIDVVVVGSGIEMAQAFGRKLGRGAHVSVFKNFGTAQVKYHDTEVEFVGSKYTEKEMPTLPCSTAGKRKTLRTHATYGSRLNSARTAQSRYPGATAGTRVPNGKNKATSLPAKEHSY